MEVISRVTGKHSLWTLCQVFLKERMRICYVHTVLRHSFFYHMDEITGAPWYIYTNSWLYQIDPSGRKGSVSYGLGADISLPPCLATGIWNSAPKATSGPKSRGASFGTALWHHVQRYCAILFFFYANLLLRVLAVCKRKFPRTAIFEAFQNHVIPLLLGRHSSPVTFQDLHVCDGRSRINLINSAETWRTAHKWLLLAFKYWKYRIRCFVWTAFWFSSWR